MAASLLKDEQSLPSRIPPIFFRKPLPFVGPCSIDAPEQRALMAPPVDQSDPRWQLTSKVLNSPLFEKSPRLRAFLTFICELELTGRRLDINEQQIGVD